MYSAIRYYKEVFFSAMSGSRLWDMSSTTSVSFYVFKSSAMNSLTVKMSCLRPLLQTSSCRRLFPIGQSCRGFSDQSCCSLPTKHFAPQYRHAGTITSNGTRRWIAVSDFDTCHRYFPAAKFFSVHKDGCSTICCITRSLFSSKFFACSCSPQEEKGKIWNRQEVCHYLDQLSDVYKVMKQQTSATTSQQSAWYQEFCNRVTELEPIVSRVELCRLKQSELTDLNMLISSGDNLTLTLLIDYICLF